MKKVLLNLFLVVVVMGAIHISLMVFGETRHKNAVSEALAGLQESNASKVSASPKGPVAIYLQRVGNPETSLLRYPLYIHLRPKVTGSWLEGEGSLLLNSGAPGFLLEGRLASNGLVWFGTIDRMAGEQASQNIRLFGMIPMLERDDTPLMQWELVHYLLFAPLDPGIVKHIRWVSVDPAHATGCLESSGVRVCGIVTFHPETGLIQRIETEDGLHLNKDHISPGKIRAVYDAYETIRGIKIPTAIRFEWLQEEAVPFALYRIETADIVTKQ